MINNEKIDNKLRLLSFVYVSCLTTVYFMPYRFRAVPQWAVGRENLNIQTATIDANFSVFFCVAATTHPITAQCRSVSMVALVGQLNGWLVFVCTSILTPANVTTLLERENSGGDSLKQTEIIIMMTPPIQAHPQFIWLFLAVCRSDMADRPHRETVTAPDERTARRMLAAQFILFFAGRLPVREVYHG